MATIPPGLIRRQAYLLVYLERHSSITRPIYQVLAGIAHTTARRDLHELVAAGLIVRLGSTRSARYAIAPHSRSTSSQVAPQLLHNSADLSSNPHPQKISQTERPAAERSTAPAILSPASSCRTSTEP